ncbi:terminase large subunit [Jeongeupia chitinilytica]|uniref:Terminase n=1 Tax=Jeongeupia chitinilytica TaxID=1041641 RepID=A0ABQ3GZW5_9NEIS|nr:terminase TerL endonuclease subunit [Jeongeupia chitinilytica]GHD59476.1 terminase [Jeongeupia chitinilytica]
MLEGRIVAGRYTRLAIERHFRDLKNGGERGLVFRIDHARHVIDFFKHCRQSSGEWGGQPIVLQPWQQFWLAVTFGWRRIDGSRRFRTWYEEVARKNGKSTKLSAIGLYLFAMDKEKGAQVFTAATKLDQAKITHKEAEMMVQQSPGLRQLISVHNNRMFIAGTANLFVPLGADAKTQDGLNVHGAIIDELHAHPSRALWDVIETATGARRSPLLYAITTAGENIEGSICLEQRGYLIRVLEGTETDDSFGGVIYTLDADDDWRDEKNWIKANPNMGVSIKVEQLRDMAKKAAAVPTALFNFLTKRLNIWTQLLDAWLSLDDWDACGEPFDETDFHGRYCYGGLDVSKTTDLTAWVLVFPPQAGDPNWTILPRFFVPEDQLERREQKDRVDYRTWAQQDHLQTTPGRIVDQEQIRLQVLADQAVFDIREIGYDDWNSLKLAGELAEAGLQMVEIPQNFQALSAPSKFLEEIMLNRLLRHGGHPVLRWNAGNVVLLQDTNGNLRPNKRKSREKIDGIVATVMALNRAMFPAEPDAMPGVIVL